MQPVCAQHREFLERGCVLNLLRAVLELICCRAVTRRFCAPDRSGSRLERPDFGGVGLVDPGLAAVHDRGLKKQKSQQPQGEKWPELTTAIPPKPAIAPARSSARTATPTSSA